MYVCVAYVCMAIYICFPTACVDSSARMRSAPIYSTGALVWYFCEYLGSAVSWRTESVYPLESSLLYLLDLDIRGRNFGLPFETSVLVLPLASVYVCARVYIRVFFVRLCVYVHGVCA